MSNEQNNGGPAFPVDAKVGANGEALEYQTGAFTSQFPGMTLRDYFAAKALPCAYMAWNEGYFGMNEDVSEAAKEMAGCAYQLADAMLKAREA